MATLKNTTINDTGFFGLPVGTTAQRPVSPANGYMRLNTTTSYIEVYYNGSWINTNSVGAGIITNNLLLYYDYGNSSCYPGTGTTVTDLSGNGNTGTMAAGVSYSSSNGGIMTMNGSGAITTNYKVPGTARSHFYWVKYASLNNGSGYQLSGTQEGGAYTYIGIQNGGQVYFYIGSNIGAAIATTVATNTWYQLGQVINASGTVTIYVNGVSVYTTSGSLGGAATSSNFQIGSINNNYYLNGGSMGLITLYGTDLSAAQVTQNYDATKARYGY